MRDRLELRRELLGRFKDGDLRDRELLAALLTYCRAEGPTELSDMLLDHFGGLREFLDCEFEELCALRGLTKEQALFLWTVRECAARASKQRLRGTTVSSPAAAARLARRSLGGWEDGACLALYLDRELRLLDLRPAAWIGSDPGELSPLEVAARASELDCTNVILARGSSTGDLSPEEERRRDLNALGALRQLDVTLLDIIILRDEGFTSLMELGFFDWEVEDIRKHYHGKEAD